MGFGDKFKDLAKQAQTAVAEHKDQIAQAVDNASVVANERTHGKYADKIGKLGEKAGKAVEKLGATEAAAAAEAAHAPEAAAAAEAAHAPEAAHAAEAAHAPEAAHAAEPTAPVVPLAFE